MPYPGNILPGKNPGTHCTERWVGPGAGLERYTEEKNPSLPPAFETWTIQAVASHYNNYTTLAFIQCLLWPQCSYATYSVFENILLLPTI
jgi:hypothetical protein